MPRSDGFLGRWSRRKAEARAAPEPAAVEAVAAPELPAMETLNGASDYTAFLQKGVSAVIQQQALRRAWESDDTIAAFRGMADYDWDFNAPSYGRLWATDDVVKLVQDVLASPPAEEPREESGDEVLAEAAVPVVLEAVTPAEGRPVTEPAALPRRHGSALPC